MPETSDVEVVTLDKKSKIIWTVIIIISIVILGYILQKIGGAQQFVDSTTTILQVVAQIFMIKRLVEQWITWIVVDIVTIGMWFTAFITTGNDITVLIMWIAYLVNALYGFYNWRKIFVKQEGKAA
jgi:nicotinamide mononucleotide transporter